MDKLKPCPFCGGEARFVLAGWIVGWIECPDCKASQFQLRTEGEAIEAWNTRTQNDFKE